MLGYIIRPEMSIRFFNFDVRSSSVETPTRVEIVEVLLDLAWGVFGVKSPLAGTLVGRSTFLISMS